MTRWFDSSFAGKKKVVPQGRFDRNDLKQKVRMQTFCTNRPEDVAELERLYNEAAVGKVMVGTEDKQWIPAGSEVPGNYWMIFLRWAELSVEPKEANRTEGVNLNASAQHPAVQPQ